jgi:hypothetical protein
MNLQFQRLFLLFLVLVLISSACAQQDIQATKPGIEMLDLSNASIDLTPASQALPPTDPPQPTPTTSTTVADTETVNTPPPTETTPPNNTSTPSCINKAEFVKHLNVSYNTQFKPNVPFAKVWLVKNTGTCTWSSEYKLIFFDGDQMGAATELVLGHEVPPGETVDLRVNLLAPPNPSAYENQWLLQDDTGQNFGVGTSGIEPLRVQIVVVSPLNLPKL